MDRLNAFMVCSCGHVVEAIFFAPRKAPAVFDRTAVDNHVRTHPRCKGTVGRLRTREIDVRAYEMIRERY